jgi:mono/diheme cytochrome c family protein
MKASRMIGIGLTVALLAVGVAIPAFAGGWAVVTLDSLPQGVAPGAAFTIGFTVRQHGVTPLSNLDPAPQVTAKNAQTGEVVRSTATDDGPRGHYAARLALPSSGEWGWGIQAFGGQQQPMPPILVADPSVSEVASAAAPTPTVLGIVSAVLAALGIGLAFRRRFVISGIAILLAAIGAGVSIRGSEWVPPAPEAAPPAAQAQGAALFVAKGCVVCHVNSNVQESESFSLSIGPDLTRYSNDPAFLAGWLAEPVSIRPTASMPDLGLNPDEIDALIAFLNGEGDA